MTGAVTTMSDALALIALLRQSREGDTWRSIAEAVLERQSAGAVWNDRHRDTLLGDDGQAIAAASEDLRRWQERGWNFLSILDERYPRRVREIHEAPPFLFAVGTLREPDVGVAVVGSR